MAKVSPESSDRIEATTRTKLPATMSADANKILETIPPSMDAIEELIDPLLMIGAECNEIYPIVAVGLASKMHEASLNDRKIANRKNKETKTRQQETQNKQLLAEDTAKYLKTSLSSAFTGRHDKSKFILLVRLVDVSTGTIDSSKSNNKRFWNIKSSKNNDSTKKHRNTVKFEVGYCLFERESGKVTFVSTERKVLQKNLPEEAPDVSSISELMSNLANKCATSIRNEIVSVSHRHPIPRRMPSFVPMKIHPPVPRRSCSIEINNEKSTCWEEQHDNRHGRDSAGSRGNRIARISGGVYNISNYGGVGVNKSNSLSIPNEEYYVANTYAPANEVIQQLQSLFEMEQNQRTGQKLPVI